MLTLEDESKLQLEVHRKIELLTAHWPHSQECSLRTAGRCMGDSWTGAPPFAMDGVWCVQLSVWGFLPDPEH